MPDSLTFLVGDVSRLIRQNFERELDGAGLGITAGEARVLRAVGLRPGSRQNSLAETLNVEPMTMCGYLDRLESAQMVTRKPDPSDRRARLVYPTEDARDLIFRIEALALKVRQKATAGLAEHQVVEMREGLDKMRLALLEPEPEPA